MEAAYYIWGIHITCTQTYKIHPEGEKTRCLVSCPVSPWGKVIYYGGYNAGRASNIVIDTSFKLQNEF